PLPGRIEDCDRLRALASGRALLPWLSICPGRRGTTEPQENAGPWEALMRRSLFGAAVVGAFLLVTSIARADMAGLLAQAPADQVGMSAKKLERIREALSAEIDQGKLPGAVVLVARKGKLVYADAVGFQDKSEGKAMTLDSVFRIYSMTKPLVSAPAMLLVEEGKLQLTAPVSKFLPAFKSQRVSVAKADGEFARLTYTNVAADREMTVQDLLRHTSGLAYGEITQNAAVKDAYTKAGVYLPGVRDYDARDLTPAEEAERVAAAPPAPPPRPAWEASYRPAPGAPGAGGRAGPGPPAGRFWGGGGFQAAAHGGHGFLSPFRQSGAAGAAAGGRSRQRPADQGDRRLRAAEERFRRRRRGLHRGGLSALHPDAAQRRPARRHKTPVAHDDRADDLRSSRHPHPGADHPGRAAAGNARLHVRPRLRGAPGCRRRRRARLGGRIHVGRLCRHLLLGRPQGADRRGLYEPGAEPDPRLLPQAGEAARVPGHHGLRQP